ncbi:MAG: prepilin-type N-terminal cleavage/methylation domain-containing protein [Candidatus Acidiferrum sp.]
MTKTNRREQGFSLIELMMALAIMLVLGGLAMYRSFGSTESNEANSAMDIVAGQLRVARQVAISQRRPVQVTIIPVSTDHGLPTIGYLTTTAGFTGAAAVNNGGVTPANTMPLPRQTNFILEANVPDTPMNFGTCGAVCIGGVSNPNFAMYFSPTGQFSQDQSGAVPLNGTIFVGLPGQPGTARAVTIMGSTGRVRPYTYVFDSATTGHWTE